MALAGFLLLNFVFVAANLVAAALMFALGRVWLEIDSDAGMVAGVVIGIISVAAAVWFIGAMLRPAKIGKRIPHSG